MKESTHRRAVRIDFNKYKGQRAYEWARREQER